MDYENKKKALFECLDAAEKNLEGSCLKQKDTERRNIKRPHRSNERRDKSIERYKSKDSIFKRPELPINKVLPLRKVPDYERNPHKYQHYTLSDVSDTSDRMNTSAAFAFLRQLEERKQKEGGNDGESSHKIVFKNSTKLKPKDSKEEEEAAERKEKIQGNKFVMKEYVVGEKKQKPKKQVSREKTQNSAKQLRLSHLDDDEDE